MTDMTWKTAIAKVEPEDVIVRGHRLSELVGRISYTEMAFLLVRGTLPAPGEREMLDAVLVTLADHGISPTTIVARTLASCGTPIQASMAGAMLSIADWHGGSGEEMARLLQSLADEIDNHDEERDAATLCSELVRAERAMRRPLPGFGHPQHTAGDPRARALLDVAHGTKTSGRFCDLVTLLGKALGDVTGREALRYPNITGALAAVLLDLGFPWTSIRGIVISARSLGLTAHVVEELDQGNKWRHVPADQVEYTGTLPS